MALESSRIAYERARRSVGGVGSGLRASMRPHPLFVREARGAHVWDLDGGRAAKGSRPAFWTTWSWRASTTYLSSSVS